MFFALVCSLSNLAPSRLVTAVVLVNTASPGISSADSPTFCASASELSARTPLLVLAASESSLFPVILTLSLR